MEDKNKNQSIRKHKIEKPIKKINNIKIIWFAFLSAIFVYNITVVFLLRNEDNFISNGFVGMESDIYNIIFYVLVAFSLVQLVILFKFNSDAKKNFSPLKKKSEFEKGLPVIKIAIAEAIAIYGLMLFLANGIFNHLILFTILALIGMFLTYPKN